MDRIKLSRPSLGDDEIVAVEKVLRSGDLVFGREGRQFEAELKSYLGCQHAILVSSGTAALHLALLAHEIGKGDAVIVPGFTFPATVNAVMMAGAAPVIVDVDPKTYCIDPALIQEAIAGWAGSETIKAIVPVHEFGHPSDLHSIQSIAQDCDLLVIEDAACAIGGDYQKRKIGAFGNTACFSFHPRKVLTTGEGGLVTTEDDQVAQRIRALRNHGLWIEGNQREFIFPGFNYRLTDIQASIGRVQLRKLDCALGARRNLKRIYDWWLKDCPFIHLPNDDRGHTWQTYMVVLDEAVNRDALIRALCACGIESSIGANALSLLTYTPPVSTPISENLFRKGLALPFCEVMTEDDCAAVARALLGVLETQITA